MVIQPIKMLCLGEFEYVKAESVTGRLIRRLTQL